MVRNDPILNCVSKLLRKAK